MSQEKDARPLLTASDVAQLPLRERVGLVIQATDIATTISQRTRT